MSGSPLLPLFKEQLENESQALAVHLGLTERGQALIWWYFTKLAGLRPADIDDIVCDGGGDLGIDALWIDDENRVHFFQFKNPVDAAAGFPGGDVDKVLAGLTLILQRKHDSVANPELRDRIEEIYQSVPQGYTLHLVSSGGGIGLESREKLDGFRESLRGPSDSFFTYQVEDLRYLQDAFYRRNLPAIEQPIYFTLERQAPYQVRSADHDCYMFHSVGSYLAQLYNEHGEKLLQQNIRVFQGDNATNAAIRQACTGDHSANFLHFNNGVTFLCENAQWDQFVSKLTLHRAQVVNGGQTIRILHEAHRAAALRRDVLVSVRVITAKGDKDFASNVAVNLNNQNRMESAFLRSNDPRIIQLASALGSRGWYLERREGELAALTEAERRTIAQRIGRPLESAVISLKEGTQAYVATYGRQPELAKKNPQRMFLGARDGGYFERIFDEQLSADKFIIAHGLKGHVDALIRQFMTRKRRKARVPDWRAEYRELLGDSLVDSYGEYLDQVVPQSGVFLSAILFEREVRIRGVTPERLAATVAAGKFDALLEVLWLILEFTSEKPEVARRSWPTLLKSQSFFENVTSYIRGLENAERTAP